MKRLLAAITALSALSFGPPAIAADMPLKARPIVAPVAPPTWSGFYFGGQAGFSWADASYVHTSTANFVSAFSFDPNSAIGGAHAGVQGQWGDLVLGVEGSFNWTHLHQTQVSVPMPPRYFTFELDDIGTVVGKVGHAANNWLIPSSNWLIYAKGGWATANIRTEGTNPLNGVTAVPRLWESGWTVGGGVDYLVAANWILGADVNYYNINFSRDAIATNGLGVSFSKAKADVYAVTGRLSYKIGP